METSGFSLFPKLEPGDICRECVERIFLGGFIGVNPEPR